MLSFLDDLPAKQFKKLVNTIFNLLKNPAPQYFRIFKGYPYRRVDFGEYRVVYQVQGEDLQIFVIGKRKDDDVYKKLNRMAK